MDPSAKTNAGDLGLVHARIAWCRNCRPQSSPSSPGEYTHKPIKSQYGWHVMQLIETRDLTPPPFDQVKQRLVQVVQAKKFRAYQDELMRTAKIEKTEPAAAAALPHRPRRPRPPRRLRAATPPKN